MVCYRDKEDEIKRLQELNKNQLMQSEKSLEEFKLQVEKNQTRMYDEMKQQVRNQEAARHHKESVIVVENGSLNSFFLHITGIHVRCIYQTLIMNVNINLHKCAFQMERVETDLNKSKQAREKQSREFSKQIEEERNQHERKVFIDKKSPFP